MTVKKKIPLIDKILKQTDYLKDEKEDIVVFMVAYTLHDIEKKVRKTKHINDLSEVMKKYHIQNYSANGFFHSTDNRAEYELVCENASDITPGIEFTLLGVEQDDPSAEKIVNELVDTVSIECSCAGMLDSEHMKVSFSFKMEDFLATIDDIEYSVNPRAFVLNSMFFVAYSLKNNVTGKALCHNEIYGRKNNVGIQQVDKIIFLDGTTVIENKRISDVIMANVWGMFDELTRHRFELVSYGYSHNTLVISNNVSEPFVFFENVFNAELPRAYIRNISSSKVFEYFSCESIGLVTNFDYNEIKQWYSDVLILEAFKMLLLLEMITDFKLNSKLSDIIEHQTKLGYLFYPSRVPMVTLNVIESIKSTKSFKQCEEGVNYKIKALNLKRENQKNRNAIFLNVLLYVLALLGSYQTLQVLKEEFGISFGLWMIIITLVFIAFGVWWFIGEIKGVKEK